MKTFFKTAMILVFGWVLLLALTATHVESFSSEPIHHGLQIDFEPVTRVAKIKDRVQLKTSLSNCGPFVFYLHSSLKLTSYQLAPGWQLKTGDEKDKGSKLLKIEVIRNSSASCPETFLMSFDYSGVLHDPDDTNPSSGFFFSGDSYFYPRTKEPFSLVTFSMQVSLPKPWQAVSQGQRIEAKVSGLGNTVLWQSSRPSEEIFLIGNRFHVYEQEHNGLSLYAFLLEADDELANRYLQTAKGYIDFYSKIMGPYPYEKFALVENSRQTGYGMPSFTLLGSKIIRFPFILHSSYPHEILHNWWGNGVFPDLQQGNWSEGLTAYLADHLLLELKGKGAAYRFQEMMKFSNYVNKENDFPLSKFAYRDSMVSQAIGYAKLLMVFHMLRNEVGEDNFLKGLKIFYETYQHRYAGYDAMCKVFEGVSGQNLSGFFEQWVHRKGAPEISLKQTSYVSHEGRYDLSVTVEQASPAFRLKLPVAIWTLGSPVGKIYNIQLEAGVQKFNFQLSSEPVAVRLDPYNDVMRRLDVGEAPASLSQTYGAKLVTAFVPENDELGYRKFAQSVAKQPSILTGRTEYPEGSLWVFGRNSLLQEDIMAELRKSGIEVGEKGIRFPDTRVPWKDHSFVFTLNRPDQKKGTLTWVVTDTKESIPGLMRKLPHYGKYGYLVFEGSVPDNRRKGLWPSNPVGLQKIFVEGNPLLLPEQKPLLSFKPFN